jgi:hypothetical protein
MNRWLIASTRGWGVPLHDVAGRISMVTSSTIYCTLQRADSASIALYADETRPLSCYSIVVDEILKHPLAIDSTLTIANGLLSIERSQAAVCIDLRAAQLWQPPVLMTLDPLIRRKMADDIELIAGSALLEAARRIGTRLDALRLALVTESTLSVLRAAVRRLIGFGPGLTPSGDDVLCGLLVSLAYSAELSEQHSRLSSAVLESLDATSDLSGSALQVAVDGHCDEAVSDVLRSSGDSDMVRAQKIRRLLGVGATSGADLLTGLHTGLRLSMPVLVGQSI